MMNVHPDQDDTKYKNSCMAYRACFQLPLDSDGIDFIMNTQMLNNPNGILVHLEELYNRRKLDIGTLKKERGDIFSECYTEIFKAGILRYTNSFFLWG